MRTATKPGSKSSDATAHGWRLGRRRFLALAARTSALLLALPGVAWAQEKARAIHHATRNTLRGAFGVRVRRALGTVGRTTKPYPGAERVQLAAVSPQGTPTLDDTLEIASAARSFGGDAIPFAILSRLLRDANGVTGRAAGGRALRAAPSAGALYSGEVYVVAERVTGLAPGVYYYSPLRHDLARISNGPRMGTVAMATEEPLRSRRAAAAIVLTNVFARYRVRYANRGYRYALIDSGHIAENLRLSAAGLGLGEWGPLRFHDSQLTELLEIDGVDESVCSLHVIGTRAQAPDPKAKRPDPSRRLVEAGVAGVTLPKAAEGELERYHAATSLVPEAEKGAKERGNKEKRESERTAPDRPTPAAADARPEREGTAPVISLVPPATALPRSPVSLGHAILTRRSTLAFTADPITAARLAYVLQAANGHPAARRTEGLEVLVFLHRGTLAGPNALPMSPGLYRSGPKAYEVPSKDPGGKATDLTLLRPGDHADHLVSACLGQAKAGEAACGIAIAADLDTAARRAGERSYRDLCLEAGAIAQRVYLAAESVGISARNLAAYVDDQLNELAGLDGESNVVLHLTMLGPGD